MVTKVRTIDFLPEIFRTDANRQFLNATLDQLVQQPDLTRVQGFIGRKFGKGANPNDSYVPEIDKTRTDYQLEPGVVFLKPNTTDARDFLTYPGLIDSLQTYGSVLTNDSVRFANEFYSWDSFADLDKLINYSQYYWLPMGPDSVTVSNSLVYDNVSYNVVSEINSYSLQENKFPLVGSNPELTLLRGGTYTFSVSQTSKFWIQTQPGILGIDPNRNNISTREVYGVDNNGINAGVVTFKVPYAGDQNTEYTTTTFVDLVTTLKFDDLNGKLLSHVGNIDGISELNNKTIILYGHRFSETGDISAFYDSTDFSSDDNPQFEDTDTTYLNETIYKIKYVSDDTSEPILKLVKDSTISFDQELIIGYGKNYIGKKFARNTVSTEIELLTNKTSALDTLYYQDSENPFMFGKINIIDDMFSNVIYVEDDIIGKKNYVSPNGVTFTNGLKVIFDGEVSPSKYFGKEYYVEGVGTSINLIPVKELVIFEPFGKSLYAPYDYHPYDSVPYGSSLLHVPLDKDYITINRNSNDRNAWSRGNRWFHVDVLNATIKHTGSATALAVLGNPKARANRPIIEFYPNIKLFDTGVIGRGYVDFIDFVSTDALNQVAGYTFNPITGGKAYEPNDSSIELFTGAKIIFANDSDVNVRSKIYLVNITNLTLSDQKTITLSEIPTGTAMEDDQVFVSLDSVYGGKSFRFNGSVWEQAQQKDYVNQAPKFDVFNKNGISFADASYYKGTSFTGSTLFEYAIGSGAKDAVLGFPLKYSDASVIGDITFEVSLNNDQFTHADGLNSITESVNTGYPYIYSDRSNYTRQLGWQTAAAESFQYQTFNTEYDPAAEENAEFYCGVIAKDQTTVVWPVVRVYLNDEILPASEYTVSIVEGPESGYYTKITLNTNPTSKSEVQILINTSQGKDDFAFYDIPNNLAKNPFNTPVTELNLGDIRAHYETICSNVPFPHISGPVFGPNNYRDLGNLVPYGTNIIQNSAPLTMASAFLRNKDYNIFDALTYSSNEYVKFKNLLINTIDNTDYTVFQSSADMLDDALSQITAAKNQTNSFFYSDMLPSGSPFFTKSYSFNVVVTTASYQLSRIYDFNNANYYGVLVYLTRNVNGMIVTTQLVKGIDYDISSDEPKLTLHTDLKLKDIVTINEYNQTYGSYIPNTPTKLGLYPAYTPEVIYDESYLYPTYFIKGHDGSLTKLYGEYDDGILIDFRDKVLLEFETRIYNNLKISAKIPLTQDEIIPGYFRDTGYTYDEIQKIHSYGFLNWVGKNRVDYKTQYYSVDSPKTYNYIGSTTKWSDEVVIQGNWRGIYNYFYDTCTPDKTPWEMLGFSIKPTWWEKRYGAAPYTSDNLVLWQDIENGIDYNDGNPRVLSSRVRPGLINILPVDSQGKLKEVTETILASYDSWKINNDWKVGDVGPVEYSYLKSSSYPFELMRLYALTKPAKFFALTQDVDLYKYNEEFNQYLYDDRFRLGSKNIINYGSGKAQHSSVNWVVDYIQSTGMPGYDKITELLSNLDVRLIYRLAGFSDKNLLKLYIENSSSNSKNSSLMIPDESFSLLLYNNQPYISLTYSAAVVQRTENGYKVYGNSQNTAYFKTVSPSIDGAYQTITVEGLSVNLSRKYNLIENIVPYGTEFLSAQSLCEFLINYGRYLVEQGVLFESIENGIVLDWQQSITEVLYWIQTGWEVGSTINLNPAAGNLHVNKENNIVQPLTFQKQNYVLNQNLVPIQTKDLAITRDGTSFEVSPLNVGDTISYFVADLSNFEHGIVLNNSTLFNDVIYNLVTGLRQLRIKIKGVKTAEWNGQLNAHGFILNQDNVVEWQQNIKYPKGSIVTYKNSYWISNELMQPSNTFNQSSWTKTDYEKIQKGLLPNPSNRAYESTLYYDVSAANLEHDADLLGYSLIGYRPRDYFASADFDDITQVNVHQNLIAGKGTRSTIDALSGITLPMGQISYDVYENWAIKLDEYGGILNQNYIELKLDESLLNNNPNIISVIKDEAVPYSAMQIPLYSVTSYQRPILDINILPLRDSDAIYKLPSAGYVNFNDVKVHTFDFDTLINNTIPLSQIYQNDYVWIADINGSWQVYTLVALVTDNKNISAITCKNNLDNTATIEFNNHHGLAKDDLIAIINFDTSVDGYYKISAIPTITSITVELELPNSTITINSFGLVAKFQPHRVSMPSDIANVDLISSLQYQKSKFWVDNSINGNPAVYSKSPNFAQLNFNHNKSTSSFGSAVLIDEKLGYFVTDSSLGKLYRYVYSDLTKIFILAEEITQTSGYGSAMAKADDILVVSTPNSSSSKVYVYNLLQISNINEVVEHQLITISSKRCGDAIAMSGDKQYMYISATGAQSEILAYKLDAALTYTSSSIALDTAINLGNSTFSVLGDHTDKLKLGSNISFSNNTTDKTYYVVGVMYDGSKTKVALAQGVDKNLPISTTIYIASYNYSLVGSLTVPGITTADEFGYSISTNYDGSKVFVSAPQKDGQGLTDVGSVYVFSRIKQVFKSTSNSVPYKATTLTCIVNLTNPVVYKNGKVLTNNTEYTTDGSPNLTILNSINSGDIIEVQTSSFVLTQTILASDVISDLRLGTRFGNSIDSNINGTELLVGAPYNINSNNQEGTIYRFTNSGKKYGLITGTTSVTLASSATILINGYSVTLPATGINDIVKAINNANITNVIASKTSDNKLVIQLRNNDLAPVNDKLTITVLDSTVLAALGITEYVSTQTIINVNSQGISQFGNTIKFNEYDSFVVSAPVATRYYSTTFDFTDDENNDNDTIFDNNFTKFLDGVPIVGEVYLYDYLPAYNESLTNIGKFIYAQSINDTNTNYSNLPLYGQQLAFSGYSVLIGSPNAKTSTNNGILSAFANSSKISNWSVYRNLNNPVDIEKIQNISLYDNTNNNRLDILDYIDPIQGKLLGAVRENLDFICSVDPAGYNYGNAIPSVLWGENFVGKIWFNTRKTKFVDYYQNDIVYNSEYWGSVFPESEVEVYTWIESNVDPLNYDGAGTPYNNEAFTISYKVNNLGALVARYYYWVRNTNTVFTLVGKTLPDTILESYIRNPISSGIAFFAPIKPNVFALYNSSEFINHTYTSLHIGFGTGKNDDTIHNEYKLIRDGFADDFLPGVPSAQTKWKSPESLYNKLLNSLSGVDDFGQLLPDPYLPSLLRTGIASRPRQSLFNDRLTALKNYCQYANDVLAKFPFAETKTFTFLSASSVTDYWEYVYWWADGYNDQTKPNAEVPKYFDLSYLTPFVGMLVRVSANSDGKKEVYEYDGSTWNRVGLEDGTLRIKSSLYGFGDYNFGFDSKFYDADLYDHYPSYETKQILRALNEQIFIDEYAIYRNKGLILLFECIQSETNEKQNYLPWLNKTSLVDVSHTLRELTQTKKFQQEEQELIEGYVNETKPYNVVIKEFSLRYTKTESYLSAATDFDTPPKFDSNVEKFTMPEMVFGNTIADGQNSPYSNVWNDNLYTDWRNNFGLSMTGSKNYKIAILDSYINNVDKTIVVDNSYGLPIAGALRINNEIISYTEVNRETNTLSGITRGVKNTNPVEHFGETEIFIDLPGAVVLDAGRNYTSPPVITAYIDTSIYPEPRRTAQLKPVLLNNKVISVDVIDSGEGYAVEPEIIIQPSLTFTFDYDNINSTDNTIIINSIEPLITGDCVKYQVPSGVTPLASLVENKFYYVGVVQKSDFSYDQLIALYRSKHDAVLDVNRIGIISLTQDVGHILAITARIIAVMNNTPTRALTTTLRFDRTSYRSKVIEWNPSDFYSSKFKSLTLASSSTSLRYATTFNDRSGNVVPSGGTGAKFTVYDMVMQGIYQVTLSSAGTNYSINNVITILGALLGGKTPDNDCVITVTQVTVTGQIEGFTFSGTPANIERASLQNAVLAVVSADPYKNTDNTIVTVDYTDSQISPGQVKGLPLYFYNILPPYTWTGSTLGSASITVHRPNFSGTGVYNQYVIRLNAAGSIYSSGDKITIDGSLLGGVDGTNDLIIDVIVAVSGAIKVYNLRGVAVGNFTQYYVYPTSSTELLLYRDSELKIPVSTTEWSANSGTYAYLPDPSMILTSHTFTPESIVTYNNKLYVAVANSNDQEFDYNKWEEISGEDPRLNALDRTMAFYQPTDNMPGKDLTQLLDGVIYPNNIYYGNKFSNSDILPIDTILNDQPFYPTNINIKSVVFGNGQHVAIADSSKYSLTLTSDNGVDWKIHKISDQVLGVQDIIYSDTYYVMATTNVNTPIMISTDGINWATVGPYTSYDILPFDNLEFDRVSVVAPIDKLYGLTYNNGKYIAVGDDILTSTDGNIWDQSYNAINEFYLKINSVAYVNIPLFAGYIAISFGTDVSNTTTDSLVNRTRIMTSIDGSYWTRSTSSISNTSLNAIFASDELIVICGDNASLYYSTTNGSWDTGIIQTSPITDNLLSGTYFNGVYVVVGENGIILNSYDGINWNQRVSNTTKKLSKVIHNGGYFIAVGDNATVVTSSDSIVWKNVSNIITDDTFYEVKGDKFLTGYGPEELVAGVIYDNLSMRVTTSPSSNWDAATYQHSGFVMKSITVKPRVVSNLVYSTLIRPNDFDLLVEDGDIYTTENNDNIIIDEYGVVDPTGTRIIVSFAGVVSNPIQVAVYVVDSTSLIGRRLYEGIDYSIDKGWIPKIITLSNALDVNELCMIEVYEVGGGNQIVKSNSEQLPLLTNSNEDSTWTEINLDYDYQATVYTTPICYHNGIKLEFNLDYFLKPSTTGQTHLVFSELYDTVDDYISFAVLGNSVTDTNAIQFGYSVPETQVFEYTGSNAFVLSNNFDGTNDLNSIVELNGSRLIYGTDYSITGTTLTVTASLVANDIVAVTSYNDTTQQYLNTQTVTSFRVAPVVYVDSTTNPLTIVTEVATGLSTGNKIRIDGLTGADQLNDNTYYVKVNSPTELELYLDASRRLPVSPDLVNAYIKGGYIWKDSDTVGISQPFDLTDPTRFFVSVNGFRLDSKQLRLNTGNKLNILTAIDPNDTILITSMVSTPTPNELSYILNVDRTGLGTVYRSNSDTKTWLTVPLYQTDTQIFVKDITKLITMTSISAVAESDRISTYVSINVDIELIKDVQIYNQTTFTNLNPSDFTLGYKNYQTTIIFKGEVKPDDKLTIKLYLGDEIEINGERIQFRKVDIANNRIYQLMRGIKGTGKQKLIDVNTPVLSMLSAHQLPNYYYNRTWNTDIYDPIKGDPLQLSTSTAAKFLKIGS